MKDEPSQSLTEISVNGNVSSLGIPSAKETVLFGAEYAILAKTDRNDHCCRSSEWYNNIMFINAEH